MKSIRSITVTAVVLLFTLSVFAVPAAAAHDQKDPDHEFFPGDAFFPDTIFDGDGNENFPDTIFDGDGNENFPDTIFDGDGDQVEEGPEIQG